MPPIRRCLPLRHAAAIYFRYAMLNIRQQPGRCRRSRVTIFVRPPRPFRHFQSISPTFTPLHVLHALDSLRDIIFATRSHAAKWPRHDIRPPFAAKHTIFS